MPDAGRGRLRAWTKLRDPKAAGVALRAILNRRFIPPGSGRRN